MLLPRSVVRLDFNAASEGRNGALVVTIYKFGGDRTIFRSARGPIPSWDHLTLVLVRVSGATLSGARRGRQV